MTPYPSVRAAAPGHALQPMSPAPVREDERFGISFADLSLPEFLEQVDARIAARTPGFVATPNVDHICYLHHDKAYHDAYRQAWLRVVDGTILLWSLQLLGMPLREKLSGSDLVYKLSAHAAEKGYRVLYFGAAPGVAAAAAGVLKTRYPALEVAGTLSPPMHFERDPEHHQAAIDAIKAAKPDIMFVAMSCPRQEMWLAETCEHLGVPVSLGIGASLDFASGTVRRAPVWMQKAGLEWFWRLCLEPRRMWRRYLVQDAAFVPLFLREWRRQRQRS